MFNKILLILILINSNIYASTSSSGSGIFAKLYNAIDTSPYGGDFYYVCKIIGFLLFMFSMYTGFVSDNQQKTMQQKFWSSTFMFFGATILLNLESILAALKD